MKNVVSIKVAILLFLSIFIISCNKDDDNGTEVVDTFDLNINTNRFSNVEIGSAQLIVPQSGRDLHVEFDYKGSEIIKISFDIVPTNVKTVKANEFKWSHKYHVVPARHYKGKKNPNVHYHFHYEDTKSNPKARPAEGTYKFRITVEHKDGSKSAITKEIQVVRKFKNLEVGHDNVVKLGEDVHIEYEYATGSNTVAKIVHRIWFKEWRKGQKVAVGKWNKIDVTVPESKYKGIKNPKIHVHMDLIKGSPKGRYWFGIYVTETGQKKPIKFSTPFEVK